MGTEQWLMQRDSLRESVARLEAENAALRAELERMKRPVDSYACQRCGRATGLDAVIPNGIWAEITGGRLLTVEVVDGTWNILCLWCIDELCVEHGIECNVTLFFAGRAVCATSQSDADAEHIARLRADLAAATADRDALIESRIVALPGGGCHAKVPYRLRGYPPGVWCGTDYGYWFGRRDDAVAAVLAAAGPGPAGDTKPQPRLSDTIAAIRAAGGDAWDKINDVEAFLGRKDEPDPGPDVKGGRAMPDTDRLREIAEMADELAAERERIMALAGAEPWSVLCAWAARGERYLEIVRGEPPERVYRELLAEIERLSAAGRPAAGGGG